MFILCLEIDSVHVVLITACVIIVFKPVFCSIVFSLCVVFVLFSVAFTLFLLGCVYTALTSCCVQFVFSDRPCSYCVCCHLISVCVHFYGQHRLY